MSEGLDSKMYRKGLAESLREIRSSGEDGLEKAKFFLNVAKGTSLYQTAEAEHREQAQTNRDGSGNVEDTSTTEAENVYSAKAEMTKESRESKMVSELLDLVSTNKNFRLGISVNGRLRPGEGSTMGQTAYLLDQKQQALVALGYDYNPGEDPIIHSGDGDMQTVYTPFLKFSETESGNDEVFKYQGWINWNTTLENLFSSDTRGANQFSGGLFIRNTGEAAQAVSRELFEVICSPDSRETKAVMWKFFVDAFQKYAPEYWEFIAKEWQTQEGNQGKDIRNYFDT